MEDRNFLKKAQKFVRILLGNGPQEKPLTYSGVYDFNKLVGMWLADGRLYSRNRKLIEKQIIKIFYQTSDIDELYSMRMNLFNGKKLEKILNYFIKSQTLDLIALTTLPVEVYRLMVIFISRNVGSCSDRNKIYFSSKRRLAELEQISPMTTKEHFDILLLSDNLNMSQRMKYAFN